MIPAATFIAEIRPVQVKQEILDDDEDSKVTETATPSKNGKPQGNNTNRYLAFIFMYFVD